MIRLGTLEDINSIMKIIKEAQFRMKSEGMTQWQNNYPNETIIKQDIMDNALFVYESENQIVGTMSVFSFDSVYDQIEGSWLNANAYKVIHRIAISTAYVGKKLTHQMIDFVFDHFNIRDIRIDTHQKNKAMIKSLESQGFVLCGTVHVTTDEDSLRLAYHKSI